MDVINTGSKGSKVDVINTGSKVDVINTRSKGSKVDVINTAFLLGHLLGGAITFHVWKW